MSPFDGFNPSAQETPNVQSEVASKPLQAHEGLGDDLAKMQAELQAKLDSINNKGLKQVAQSEMSEFKSAEIEHQGDVEKITLARKELLSDLKGLKNIEKIFGRSDDFDVFTGMMGEIPDSEREQIMMIAENPRMRVTFKKYLKANGMPNSETKAKFYQDFGIQEGDFKKIDDVNSNDIIATIRETDDVDSNKDKILRKGFEDIYSQLKELGISNGLTNIMELRLNGAPEISNLNDITDYLKGLQQPEFNAIMDAIRSGGVKPKIANVVSGESSVSSSEGGISTQNLEINSAGETAFRNLMKLATDIDSSLQTSFNRYLNRPSPKVAPASPYEVMTRGITDGGDYTVNEDGKLLANGPDGETKIEMDLSTIPATGIMKLPGSEHSVPLEMEITPEMQKSINTFERVRLDIGPKIQKINGAIAFISEIPDNAPVEEVKSRLRQDVLGLTMFNELGINKAGTVEQLKNLLTPYLEGKLAEYNKELRDAQKAYQNDMSQMTGAYRDAMIKRHKGKVEGLKDKRLSGLDMIDQDVLQSLVPEINRERGIIDLGNGLQLNTDIDFAEGIFGFQDGMEGQSSKEREVYARFVNLLISGNPEGGKNESGVWLGLPIEDFIKKENPLSDTDMTGIFIRGGILNSTQTSWNKQKMRENLGLEIG